MRALSSASVVTVAATASLLSAPAAYADGVGGTVAIHDAATGAELPSEGGAKVCTFYLAASGVDGRQVGWKVVEGASGTVAETGAVALDGDGRGRSDKLALRDGRYRLAWGVDGGGTAQHTPFEVDCDGLPEENADDAEDAGDTGSGAEPSSEPDGGAEPGTEVTPEPAGSTEPSPTASPDRTGAAGPAGGSRPSAGPSGGDDLAETGSQVPAGALAAAGASLLGAGAYLVLRRREQRAQRR